MENKNQFCHKAFTLAEVLITLGVIGVVAALTIPNLVQSYKKHVTEVKLQKLYSDLTNAFSAGAIENGGLQWYQVDSTECYNGTTYCSTDYIYENYLKDRMKFMDVTKNFKSKYKVSQVPNNWTFSFNVYVVDKRTVFSLVNRQITIYLLDNNNFDFSNLKTGKNLFKFGTVYCGGGQNNYKICPGYGLYPVSTDDWRYDKSKLDEYCKNNTSISWAGDGVDFCTLMLIQNGFKFPKNYPIKF